VRGLLELPKVLAEAGDGGGGVEHDFGAGEAKGARAFGEVAVVADVDADLDEAEIEDGVTEIPGAEKQINAFETLNIRGERSVTCKGEFDAPPLPDDLNCDVDRPGPRPRIANKGKTSDLLIGTVALLPAALKIGREVRKRIKEEDHAA